MVNHGKIVKVTVKVLITIVTMVNNRGVENPRDTLSKSPYAEAACSMQRAFVM